MRSFSGPWVSKNHEALKGLACKVKIFFGSCAQINKNTFCSPELPADVIKMAKDIKPITEIKQKGNDFVVTSKTPGKSVTNSFTIGKEAEITTMDGKKLKVSNSTSPFDYFNVISEL